MRKLLALVAAIVTGISAHATDIYMRGGMNGWTISDDWKFATTDNNIYHIDNVTISASDDWKIASEDWSTVDLGMGSPIVAGKVTKLVPHASNCRLQSDYTGPVYLNLSEAKVFFGPEPTSWDIEEGDDPSNPGSGIYLRGDMLTGWPADPAWEFLKTSDPSIVKLSGVTVSASNMWKVASADWQTVNWGGAENVVPGKATQLKQGDVGNCTLNSDFTGDVTFNTVTGAILFGSGDIHDIPVNGLSGTLPVLYINIYNTDEGGNFTTINNDVLSKDLGDKNYRPGEYWLDVTPCPWAEEAGFKNIGSKEQPLTLEMKARGNYTRTGFSKKPFKLKLGKKQSLLGMTPAKSKHWAILAHADDNLGYLRNFTGFNLGHRIGLPWTSEQQPVEVVINGDYRGLYFLTESIRVGDGRVPVQELDDNATNPLLASGGYLVELDNYEEDNQIRMTEGSCSGLLTDMLRITWDTPEEYSDIQKRFITEQFTAMNNGVARANVSDELWAYMDLDDAARYYIVEEIVSHTESYHGSTYLFRDRGEGQKWHFSPLWDFGNAFAGPTDGYFFNHTIFGNTWIPSMMMNSKFKEKVCETWKWFMANKYEGLVADIDLFVDRIREAAKADRARWASAPLPASPNATPVVDNTDMDARRNAAVNHLNAKINWLKSQWGDFSNGTYPEPARDTTPAAELPSYVNPPSPDDVISIYFTDESEQPWDEVYAYVYEPVTRAALNEPLGAWPGSKLYPETVGTNKVHAIHFYSETPLSPSAKIVFNNGNRGTGNQTTDADVAHGSLYTRNGDSLTTGIENVAVEYDGPAEYYDLMGNRLPEPLKGAITIVRRGSTATKVIR